MVPVEVADKPEPVCVTTGSTRLQAPIQRGQRSFVRRTIRVRVEVRLLGGFAVWVDGDQTPAGRWGAALVKLLALSPGGRLHRDRVIDTRWPELTLDAALPRLHKAAHYARLAVEQRTAVVLGVLVPAAPNPPGRGRRHWPVAGNRPRPPGPRSASVTNKPSCWPPRARKRRKPEASGSSTNWERSRRSPPCDPVASG